MINTLNKRRATLFQASSQQSFAFALVIMVAAVVINFLLQPNFFRPAVLNGNLQTYMPLLLLAAGQTIVVIAGGVDLSLGATVSLCNVVMVRLMGTAPNGAQIAGAIAAGLLAGLLAGAVNGWCVAYLRFQPIVTTFATSFIIGGLALMVLPSPGGVVPAGLANVYRSRPLGVPFAIWLIAVIIGAWRLFRMTRWSRFVFAVGGNSMAAYMTGVPVALVQASSYVIAGGCAGFAGLALLLSTSEGNALSGAPLTLSSIVAVVLGGTRLRGGHGGITGTMIGVLIIGLLKTIISFSGVPTWWQTLVDSLIVIIALAGPGFVALLRKRAARDFA